MPVADDLTNSYDWYGGVTPNEGCWSIGEIHEAILTSKLQLFESR